MVLLCVFLWGSFFLCLLCGAERRYIEVTRELLGPDDHVDRNVDDVRPPKKVYPQGASEETLAEVCFERPR